MLVKATTGLGYAVWFDNYAVLVCMYTLDFINMLAGFRDKNEFEW